MTLHVPQSLSSLDHAAFDARFVQTWHPTYPWTKSTLSSETDVRDTDVLEWAKAQLAEAVRGEPRLRGYDFNRQAFTYAAFELVRWSLHTVHLRQMQIDELVERLRLDFTRCLEEGVLITSDPRSPLLEQGVSRPGVPGAKTTHLPLTSRYDRVLLEVLAGGPPKTLVSTARQRMQDWLQKEQISFLTTIDRGSLQIHQEGWRKEMWTLLNGVPNFGNDEAPLCAESRDRMLNLSIDAMVDVMPASIVTDELQRELNEEVFRRTRVTELSALDYERLYSIWQSRSHTMLMKKPSKDELIKRLVDNEVRSAASSLPHVPVLEPPVGDSRPIDTFTSAALAECLEPLLEQPQSSVRDAKIRERLYIPEYHMLVSAQRMLDFLLRIEGTSQSAVEDSDEEVARVTTEMDQVAHSLRNAHTVLQRAYQALNLNHAHRPSGVILDFIVSAVAGHVNVRRQRSMI